MAQTYLHGAETTEVSTGSTLIQVVKSSVILLVGIAPTGPVNTPTLVANPTAAAQFGSELTGFNIPEALAAIFAQGAGQVIVVNTFDSALNVAAVAAEVLTLVSGRASLANGPVSVPVITTADGLTTLVAGTDYTVNPFGVVSVKNRSTVGGYPDGTTLKASYSRLDPATVTGAQIIGTVDAVTGARTGAKIIDMLFSTFGFSPKILIAPRYSQLVAVANELLAMATKFRAVALLDAPVSTFVPAILSARTGTATVGAFASTSQRAQLLYPQIKTPDAASPTGATKVVPYSAFFAGVMSFVDAEFGYWYSPSNYVINGATGTDVKVSASFTDRTAENQQLNAVGIVTVFAGFGGSLRTWGNRSAAFPSETHPAQFLPVRRTADIIEDSIELAMFKYADKPLNIATLDAVRQDVNAFLASLVGRGAILDGKCVFLKEDNPIEQLANGQGVFSYDFMPPPPFERFTMKARINTDYLKKLVAQ